MILFLSFTLLSLLFHTTSSSQDENEKRWEGLEDVFPKHIPDYLVRKDFYTKKVVRRGRIELINGLEKASNESQKVCYCFIFIKNHNNY